VNTALLLGETTSDPVRQRRKRERHTLRHDRATRTHRLRLGNLSLEHRTRGDHRVKQLGVDTSARRPMPPVPTPTLPRRGAHPTASLPWVCLVNTGVLAELTAVKNCATAPGKPDPNGVLTNNTTATSENATAPDATRAFAQINAPTNEKKINNPT
jgi:hypothetical protein